MLAILSQIIRRTQAGETVALCTVVRTRGSTPQGAGAAMLVLRDGNTLGTLGGGCVEAEVRVRAQQLMSERGNRLMTFRLDHDYGWDDGLVCGGIMDIAIEVIDSAKSARFEPIVRTLHANQSATLAIETIDEQNQPARFEIVIPSTPRLLIAGAGHVGQALAAVGAKIDFAVSVIDDRPDCADPSRFPMADCILGDIQAELSRFPLDEQTYIVIVTRGHKHDASSLAAVINSPAKYLGLIGSKKKVRTILDDLHKQGIPREKLARVHAPIGLEIGAITPSEIAISIAAELIAVRHGRDGLAAEAMKMPAEQLNRWLDRKELGAELPNP
jgi:xanthine dehydrogenase accessory factor